MRNAAPSWATHSFKNTSQEVIWFNPKTGVAQHSRTRHKLELTRKSHYGYSTATPL